jgi:hypothetical protein
MIRQTEIMTFDSGEPMRVRSHLAFAANLTFQPESHRAVVGEGDLHIGPEQPTGHGGMPLTGIGKQPLEQAAGHLRGGGRGEPGAQAVGCIGRQGELGHQQEATLDLLDAAVHFPGLIAKDTVFEQPVEEPARRSGIIVRLHADEHEQAVADGAYGLACHPYFGSADAL